MRFGTRASTVVGLARTSKSVQAVISHGTVHNNVNANIGKQAIRHRARPSHSIIVLVVVMNILFRGESSQGTTLIYGYSLLVIVFVNYHVSHMCTTQPEVMIRFQGLMRPLLLCFETFWQPACAKK